MTSRTPYCRANCGTLVLRNATQKKSKPRFLGNSTQKPRVKKIFLEHVLRLIQKPISSLPDHFGIGFKMTSKNIFLPWVSGLSCPRFWVRVFLRVPLSISVFQTRDSSLVLDKHPARARPRFEAHRDCVNNIGSARASARHPPSLCEPSPSASVRPSVRLSVCHSRPFLLRSTRGCLFRPQRPFSFLMEVVVPAGWAEGRQWGGGEEERGGRNSRYSASL